MLDPTVATASLATHHTGTTNTVTTPSVTPPVALSTSPCAAKRARVGLDTGLVMTLVGALVGLFLLTAPVMAAPLSEYLPAGVTYDPAIPTPDEVLGYGVGDWHARPDQIVDYMRRLAAASPRVTFEEQGLTHEDRLQILLTITSPANHGRLEELRLAHVALSDPNGTEPTAAQLDLMPVVVWMGYSIHGNEASGANASLLAAYHLAAAQSPEVEAQLSQAIVLLDPMYNPDGLGRFAHWANTHKGEVVVGDPNHREHTEDFPGGRMNHYWFDLNRDWLLLQHPESRNRVRNFHRWKPNLLTDHHEMGTDSTFFFQPGVPSRKNPLIPEGNLDLTNRLARYHAAALDAEGRLYYSEESFDDFYPGKGSTYPDLNGGVGILFEQASSRGHLQESVNGDLSFAYGIKNHFLTSLSSIKGAVADRKAFLEHQARFFREAKAQADAFAGRAFVVHTQGDRGRLRPLLDNLLGHQVEVYALIEDVTVGGERFRAGEAVVIPLRQSQHILIRSLFEELTDYSDKTFYDVSTWSLPLAFGATYARLDRAAWSDSVVGARITDAAVKPQVTAAGDAYAYIFRWTDTNAPKALYRLLAAGYKARVATEPFSSRVGADSKIERFDRGTIVVPVGLIGKARAQALPLDELLATIATEDGILVLPVKSGYAETGIDLGSPALVPVEMPSILLAVGRGVSPYEAGEAWYLLDHRFNIPVSLVEIDRIPTIDLSRYTHIILPGGSYSRQGDDFRDALSSFARSGGTLIGITEGAEYLDSAVRDRKHEVEPESPKVERERTYASFGTDRAEQLVSGTIVNVRMDLTHPLAYGYQRADLPVFRTNASLLPTEKNPYQVVASYTTNPRISGYISTENQTRLSGQPAILAAKLGSGTVIELMDNPNFRAIWYGSTRLFLNSIFFGPIVEGTSAPDTWFED